MKVALFSPINPVNTGISDYTEEMLDAFCKHFDFDLVYDPDIEPSNNSILDKFNLIPFKDQIFEQGKYDLCLYHMGNYYNGHQYIYEALKKYPGIVVLHDFVLQGFYAERYEKTRKLDEYIGLEKKYYGTKGEEIARGIVEQIPPPIWDTESALEFPLNEEVIEFSLGLIVHSDFVKKRIKAKHKKPVVQIPHHGHIRKTFDTKAARKSLGLDKDDILVCSAGYINRNKRFETIFKAISDLNEPRLKYAIAGKDRGELITGLCEEYPFDVIRKNHLPLVKLEELICSSDICINLRYPTMGESSGSLLRMMGYGKPTIVTDFGSYREFPDHCVLKVDPGMDEKELIKRYLEALIEDEDFRLSLGEEAADFIARECSIEKCAAEYAGFMAKFSNR
jgi:glycosyltransferase involved in cell wall biosynthesis